MKKEMIKIDFSGREVERVILKGNHLTVKLLTLGATIEDICYDDGKKNRHMTLGYTELATYEKNPCYFGACVARVGNRIGGAKFTLNGKTYELEKNDGNNNLHSGTNCLCYRDWKIGNLTENSVTFQVKSPDGDMGFPGEMLIRVTYTVTENDALIIDYVGECEEDTIFNPTNHSFFNLGEEDNVLPLMLQVDAEGFTPGGPESIPDGTENPVEGTPMDFRTPHKIGERIDADFDELKYTGGYDHNYVLSRRVLSDQFSTESLNVFFAAELSDEGTGRRMEVYTSLPGLQVYTGNFLKGDMTGYEGQIYPHRGGVCLESQFFPNAINVDGFEKPIAKAGETSESRTVYRFY